MKTVTLSDGFKININEKALVDIRFSEAIYASDHGDELEQLEAMPIMLKLLLPKKEKEKLYKHLEDEDGMISPDVITKALEDIMVSDELKKSQSSQV